MIAQRLLLSRVPEMAKVPTLYQKRSSTFTPFFEISLERLCLIDKAKKSTGGPVCSINWNQEVIVMYFCHCYAGGGRVQDWFHTHAPFSEAFPKSLCLHNMEARADTGVCSILVTLVFVESLPRI